MNRQNAYMQQPLQQMSISQWKFKAKLSSCEIWQNLYDHSIAEAYLLPSSYLKKEQKNYLQRKGPGIVNCIGFLYLNQQHNYEGDAYVLLQRITNRLSNVSTLTQTQSLKVLYSVYKTLEEVKNKWGEFWLKQNCICFNTEGDVKIWKSPETWSNYPQATLLKGQRCKQKTPQLIRRIFRIVEEKCINPKILQPFKFLSNQNITLHEAYSTTLKIAQKLFIDIGIRNTIQFEPSQLSTSSRLSPQNNSKKYYKHKHKQQYRSMPSEENSRDYSGKTLIQNSFQKAKVKEYLPQKVQRKIVSSRNSPIKTNNSSRTRNYSNYDPIRIEDSNWYKYQENKQEKIINTSGSKEQAFKKKYFYQNQNTQAFQQSINNCLNQNELNIERIQGDFQTFGILQQNKQQSQCYLQNYQLKQNKKSDFDVAEMEKQLIKFNQKKHKFQQNLLKKKPSLEFSTTYINQNIQKNNNFTSGFQKSAKQDQKELKNWENIMEKNSSSLTNTIYNINPTEKKEKENNHFPMYTKHMRYASDLANPSQQQTYSKENKQKPKILQKSNVKTSLKKENKIF